MAEYRFEQIAINSTEKKKPVEEDRFNYLGLEHLDSGSLKVTRFGSEVAPIGEKLVMHKGDVLFGKRRAYQKKVAIAPFDGIFSAHGMVLRPREDVIDKSFFPLFISSDYFLDAAIKISVGSLSPTINWRDLKSLEFELPDLATQRKLADTLWSINDTMEAYKKLISATDELVKSQFMEQFGDPKTNPKGMKVTTLGSVCAFEGGSQPPRSTFIFEPREGYIRLIQIRDYKSDEYITYIPVAQARKFCNADDIMIGRYGPPIFQILQGLEGAYNVALMKAVPTDPSIDKEFLRFYLKRDELLHHLETFQQRTVGQAGIEMNELKNYPIPIPTLEQQREFVAFVQQSDKSKFAVQSCSNLNLWSSLETLLIMYMGILSPH